MENAAKALLIAGGILIAIIILSMFVMMYNRMTSIQKAQEEQRELEQIAAFNAEFESYNKQLMYGADVITLYNKVQEHNSNNPSEEIEIDLPEDFKTSIEALKQGNLSEEATEDLLKLRFKCTSMVYGNSGKVNKITIISAQ